MKKVCFFSSDARPLYKNDIFRVMSYPEGYVVHFRYQRSLIGGNIDTFKDKEGIIFFSVGNDLTKKPEDRSYTHIPIREVYIQAVEEAEDTGLIHFFLRLEKFTSASITTNNNPDLKPPKIFVTELDLNNNHPIKWFEVIDLIKNNFTNQLFYKFDLYNKSNNQRLNILFDNVEKQSFYSLNDESDYALKMSFYDTEPSSSNNYHSLKLTPSSEDIIKIVAPATIDIDARKDDRVYSILSQTISSSNAFAYINFETILKTTSIAAVNELKAIIDTTLKLEVKKKVWRTTKFALFTLLALFAAGYAKVLTDKINLDGYWSWSLALQFFLAAICGFAAAYNLYKLFDKK